MGKHRTTPGTIMNHPDICLEPERHTSDPKTRVRIAEVAKKISKGWTKFEICEWVKKEWDLSDQSAGRYWNAGLAMLAVKANDSKYVEEMRQKAIATLDRMVQTEISERKYKEANQSMELLSRLMGYNVQKTETKLTGDISFNFGSAPVEKEEE